MHHNKSWLSLSACLSLPLVAQLAVRYSTAFDSSSALGELFHVFVTQPFRDKSMVWSYRTSSPNACKNTLLECVCVREPQTAPKWGRCVKCPSPERPTSETMGTLSQGWRFRSYSTRLICSKICKPSSFWNIILQPIFGCLVIKNLILGDGCWIGNTQEGIGSQKLLFRCGGVFPSTRFYQIVGFPPGLGHHNLALVQHFVSALPKLGHQNSSRKHVPNQRF